MSEETQETQNDGTWSGLKKTIIGLLLTSSLFAENELWKFFKYSTAYASFSLNAPRYQDDKFAIVGGISTGELEIERTVLIVWFFLFLIPLIY